MFIPMGRKNDQLIVGFLLGIASKDPSLFSVSPLFSQLKPKKNVF
jgi:hypothetical protein